MSEGYEQPLSDTQKNMIAALTGPIGRAGCPCCECQGKHCLTWHPGHSHNDAVTRPAVVVIDKGDVSIVELLTRIRACMTRWAARYAASDHAQKHVKETRLLIQEIDEQLLKQ